MRYAANPASGIVVAFWGLCAASMAAAAPPAKEHAPIALHPDNPHYFVFRGKPAILVTSAEHYGAVLNRDFDYIKYLDELHAHGLNLTRTFTGAYCEDAKAFGIARNSLAPAEGKLICPWARADTSGFNGGGNKFDLSKWDPAYLKRLKDFLDKASERGIVVELNLFCPFYEDSMWRLSPMNAENNVNDVGKLPRQAVYDLRKNGELQKVQESMVERLVAELNQYDNLYYEVCNEPYFGGVTGEWQRRIIDVIVAAEKSLPNKHLISVNVANGSKKVEKPHPAVSIFNFHYATPPDAVATNFGLNKVIGDNETGFKGTADAHYRMEGWEFVLAGGGLYNNLDYSFAVGHEDGSFKFPEKSPGGGGRDLRHQMKVLKDFIHDYQFVRMRPDEGVVKGILPPKVRARVLSETGKQYAVYLHGGMEAKLSFALPDGRYKAEWVSPLSGKVLTTENVAAAGGVTELQSPKFDSDVALRVIRTK
jgi:Cellulase (glycosyl hydrolase family 5)